MKIKGIILLFLFSVFIDAITAQGSLFKTGELIRIAETDSLQNQLIATGKTVEVFGWLGNDLYSAAEFLTINGIISDDAVVAARRISVQGNIGDFFAGAAETILIDGIIEGDLFAAGREVRITGNGHIKGDVFLAGQRVIIQGGRIDGRLMAAGESFEMNGDINNSVELFGESFNFGNGYNARYGTTIYSEKEIYRENLGYIPDDLTITVEKPAIMPVILFKLGFYLSLLITGLVILRIFQQRAVDMQRFATERFWKNTGVGFISFIVIPIGIILLCILVLTIPLGIILAMLYGLALLISYLLVAMVLGVMSIFYFSNESDVSVYYWGLALGMIYLAILVNLPFIGWLFNILFLFFGLGSLVYYIWSLNNSGHASNFRINEHNK